MYNNVLLLCNNVLCVTRSGLKSPVREGRRGPDGESPERSKVSVVAMVTMAPGVPLVFRELWKVEAIGQWFLNRWARGHSPGGGARTLSRGGGADTLPGGASSSGAFGGFARDSNPPRTYNRRQGCRSPPPPPVNNARPPTPSRIM